MFRRNLSENQDFFLGETLTKFNLTNYKQKTKQFSLRDYGQIHVQKFSPKKTSTNKIKITQLENLHKNWYEVPAFGTVDVDKLVRKRKRKTKSVMNIGVTSRSQKHLIEFMNPQNLPKISIVNMLKRSPVKKLVEAANSEEKFRKFTQSYFRSVEKAKMALEGRSVEKQFEEVKAMGWSVRGYLIQGSIVLKAVRYEKKGSLGERQKIQKYKKYVFGKQIQRKVSEDYEKFVKEWLYLDQVLGS